jgi:hypothetical protein
MALKHGYKSSVGIGNETTYGTAVAPSDWMEFLSETMKLDIEKRPAQGINTTAMHKKFLSLGRTVAGDIQFEVNPDDCIGMILKAFGGQSPVSAQVGTSAAYTHTFLGANDWVADGAAGCGLTVQVNRDSTSIVDYTGCLPAQLSLTAAVGDALKATVSMVGQNAAAQGSPTSSSFSTLDPFIFHQGVVAKDAGGIDVVDFTINMNNNVNAGTFKLGQTYIKRPAKGMREISGTMTMHFEDVNIYNDFVANTSREIVLTFTHGSMASGATPYSLAITLGKCYFQNNPTPNVGSPDILTQTIPFMSIYDDATDQDYKVVLTNLATAY